jgi:nucleoside-diphosphate-sugar epimerase
MRVLVTGANGFIGTALCGRLTADGSNVLAGVRRHTSAVPGTSCVVLGEVSGNTRWDEALDNVTHVVHLAARVHVMRDPSRDPLNEFRRVNVEATVSLARQAADAGVQRFVFVSSIKVNGEGRERAYTERDESHPQDAYAQSKWEAEEGLRRVERETGMAVTIVRPPLVYGPRVRGNFRRLMTAIHKGLPLPFGSVRNCRSLIFVGNLADALARCLQHPSAVGQTFLISDGEDVATVDLIRLLAAAMGRRPRLVPVPPVFLRTAAQLVGRRQEIDRLTGSLTVDSRKIRERLGWLPPVSLRGGLAATAADYWDTHAP